MWSVLSLLMKYCGSSFVAWWTQRHFESHVGNNFLRDDAPDSACFRVPFNMVAAFESSWASHPKAILCEEHPPDRRARRASRSQ